MTREIKTALSPYVRGSNSTKKIMRDVLIALLPAASVGILLFGTNAAVLLAVSVFVSVLSEYFWCIITGKANTLSDLSAAVTGLLFGMSLPAGVPLLQTAAGSFFAVFVIKCLFGGIGYNVVNPAIAARVVMLLSFSEVATPSYPAVVDTVSSATPLDVLTKGEIYSIADLLFGFRGGAIGEVCVIALILGGIYLLCRGVISWHIPVSYILSVFLMSLFYESGDYTLALSWTLSGSVLIGAIFMATDYVTSPTGRGGKLIFGVGCGALTSSIRLYGAYPEGVSFAILLMNLTVPLINALDESKVFGGGRG